jgi:hypothetical protein
MRSRNTVDANLPCVGSAAIPHAVASALLSAIGASRTDTCFRHGLIHRLRARLATPVPSRAARAR